MAATPAVPLTANELAMQAQMAALQKSYDALVAKSKTSSLAGNTTTSLGVPGVVDSTSTGVGSGAVASPVFGPDGTMYASSTAARQAGVYNYTNSKPAAQTATAPTSPTIGLTQVANPGLIQAASGSTGNYFTSPATVTLPPGVHQ